MNENLDLTKILKDVSEGTKLWSPVYGDVRFLYVDPDANLSDHPNNPIICEEEYFTKDGKMFANYHNTECVLFPSRENRDWSKFEASKKHKEFKPYQKVLVKELVGRHCEKSVWLATEYSYYDEDLKQHYCINTYGFDDDEIMPYEGNEDMVGKTIKEWK